ncbi:uncharacterized protein LOC142975504 isoform X1 [Anticarsia gemmatalis]|uniref:uncharacterized protein LOC142975504 isoform X1 n=1 Tax=Anticarsia gemmatalis TaxID=129554 RepID=UPI003F758CEC
MMNKSVLTLVLLLSFTAAIRGQYGSAVGVASGAANGVGTTTSGLAATNGGSAVSLTSGATNGAGAATGAATAAGGSAVGVATGVANNGYRNGAGTLTGVGTSTSSGVGQAVASSTGVSGTSVASNPASTQSQISSLTGSGNGAQTVIVQQSPPFPPPGAPGGTGPFGSQDQLENLILQTASDITGFASSVA